LTHSGHLTTKPEIDVLTTETRAKQKRTCTVAMKRWLWVV